MNSEEMQAIAERYGVFKYNDDRDRTYGNAQFPLEDWMRDAFKLADAYCELLDETPIDEEWASKEIQHIHGRWLERSAYGWYIEFGHVKAHIQTRGQLRALLLAMGVE